MQKFESKKISNGVNRSDEELIKAYLGGEEKSLRILIQRYLRVIYNFSHRYAGTKADAEDIAQEVFVKVWKNLGRFNPETSFRTWLFAIAKNTAIDWLRKKKAIPFSRFDTEDGNALEETLADLAPLPDSVAEQKSFLDNTLNQLPPNHRAVLRLRYQDHLNFGEIGKVLKKSLNTVKSQHRRALLTLRELLDAPKKKGTT